MTTKNAVRDIRPEEVGQPSPVYAVWEITLRCDHACAHCGSRAAKARPDERPTFKELLDILGRTQPVDEETSAA